jgi:hypothetical protein
MALHSCPLFRTRLVNKAVLLIPCCLDPLTLSTSVLKEARVQGTWSFDKMRGLVVKPGSSSSSSSSVNNILLLHADIYCIHL